MRKIIALTLILVISSSRFLYALEIGDQDVEITVDKTYVTRYIWRGQDLYGQDDGAIQPSIDFLFPGLVAGADLDINLWGSFATSGGHEDGEEFDYTISLAKDIAEGINLSGGITYFDFPNTGSTSDVKEPWVALGFSNVLPDFVLPINISLFAGYDFQAKPGGPDEGWYYSYGFDTEIALPESGITQDDQTLAIAFTNWGNDGVADLEPSPLYATEVSVSTSYRVGYISITPSLTYTINHEEKINSGDCELWGGIDFSYSF
ncbi:hypothetical protein ACFL96_02075 [Thermoproteota archaeon]